jgi:hypothetical protein
MVHTVKFLIKLVRGKISEYKHARMTLSRESELTKFNPFSRRETERRFKEVCYLLMSTSYTVDAYSVTTGYGVARVIFILIN